MSNKQLYEKENNINKPFFPVVRLEDIIDTISEKSIQWILNNYNHIYVEWKNDVVGTRLSVPTILRRNGLWITYNNGDKLITEYYIGKNIEIKDKHWQDDTNWEDYTNKLIDGTVEYRHLSESLKQLFNKGNVTNFPDEEDLTSDGVALSFKDRKYKPENFSGLGKVIIRKNIVKVGEEYKNILTQSMINKENTIYEIRYDFDLNGEEITIPEGCVLDFQGGSINNGTIIFSDGTIKASNIRIFDEIVVKGKISNERIILEWWGINTNRNVDCSLSINKAIKAIPLGKTLVFTSTEYHISNTILVDRNINIECKGTIYSNNTKPAILLKGITAVSVDIENVQEKDANFEFKEDSQWRYNSAITLYNVWHCNANINKIKGFNTGVLLVAEAGIENNINKNGCTYNDITIGDIDSCFNGIRVMSINRGWCNGNVIHRAKFLYHSWSVDNVIPYFIYIDSYGDNPYNNNSLYFNNLMIEFGVKQVEYPRMVKANYLNGGYFHFTRIEVLRGDETTTDYRGVVFGDSVYGSRVNVDFSWQKIVFDNENTRGNRLWQSATYGVVGAKEVQSILDRINFAVGVSYVMGSAVYDIHTGQVTLNVTLRVAATTKEILSGLPSSTNEMMIGVDVYPSSIWGEVSSGRINCFFKGGKLDAQTDIQYNSAIVINLVYNT